jgi:alkylated DNA repair dioxygenase AlkB
LGSGEALTVSDLFSNTVGEKMEALALPGAEVSFYPHFLDGETADRFFELLMHETAWEEQKVFVWGKWHVQPRLVAWYGDPDATYSYSGNAMKPAQWTAALIELRTLVEGVSRVRFNSALLNLYRHERDRMGWHSDNEAELGSQPTIASLSLGETRELLFKRREKGHRGSRKLALTHGSLMLMAGETQKNWLHAINSEAKPCGPRINLTFRSVRRSRKD